MSITDANRSAEIQDDLDLLYAAFVRRGGKLSRWHWRMALQNLTKRLGYLLGEDSRFLFPSLMNSSIQIDEDGMIAFRELILDD